MGDEFAQLAVAVLHQLKNALAAAQGYAEMIAEAPEHNAQYQRLLQHSLQRAQSLLYSLESYRVLLRRSETAGPVHLDAILHSQLRELQEELGSGAATITLQRVYQVPSISGDSELVTEIVRLILYYMTQLTIVPQPISIQVAAKADTVCVYFASPEIVRTTRANLRDSANSGPYSQAMSNEVILILAKLLAAKLSGRLWVRQQHIGLRFKRARQLPLSIGEAA